MSGASSWWWRGAALAVVVPVVVALIEALAHPWFPAGDNAVIELRALDVPRHLPLVGVYSRFGFHHPGPLVFLLDAVPIRLFGPRGMLLVAGSLNAAAAVGIVWWSWRRGGRGLVIAATVAVLVFERAFASELLDPWNSWLPVLPFALAIVLAWSVWCHDSWALPVLVAVASFVVQTHVGYALLAAWLVGAGVVRASLARRVRELVVAALAALACWALPLWDQVRGDGNLGAIVSHFTGSSDPSVGWSEAAGVLAREMGVRAPWLGGDEPTAAFTAGVEGASVLLLVPLVAAVVVGVVAAWRLAPPSRARDAARRWWMVLGGVVVLSYVSVARITGDAYPYLVRWTWVVAILLWLASAWSVWLAVRSRLSALIVRNDVAIRRSAIALVGLLSLLAADAVTAQPAPQREFAAEIGALVDPVAAAAAGRGNLLVLPEGSSYQEVQSGLVPELERRGITVMVRDEDAFKYGDHRQANGRPVDARLVVAVNQAVDARDAAGAVPIARYDPLTPQERAELKLLTVKYTQQVQQQQRGETPTDPMTAADVARVEAFNAKGHLIAVYLDPGPLPPS